MTVGLATGIAQNMLNLLRGTPFTTPATPSISMHIADPGAAGTTSPSAGDATKKSAAWSAATSGATCTMALSASSGPWTDAAATETLSHLGIWIAAGATFYWSAVLTTPQAWVATNTFTLTTLTLSLTPIAA